MKRTVYTLGTFASSIPQGRRCPHNKLILPAVIIIVAGFIVGMDQPKVGPQVTLLSTNITQINTTATITNLPEIKPAIQNPELVDQWRTVQMRVTAYCPCEKCCGQSADWLTASGHKIQSGEFFVAADNRYPFGTEVIIPGYNHDKPVKVLDRGGAIHGNRLDVFFTSHHQAVTWGVKQLNVKIRTE